MDGPLRTPGSMESTVNSSKRISIHSLGKFPPVKGMPKGFFPTTHQDEALNPVPDSHVAWPIPRLVLQLDPLQFFLLLRVFQGIFHLGGSRWHHAGAQHPKICWYAGDPAVMRHRWGHRIHSKSQGLLQAVDVTWISPGYYCGSLGYIIRNHYRPAYEPLPSLTMIHQQFTIIKSWWRMVGKLLT